MEELILNIHESLYLNVFRYIGIPYLTQTSVVTSQSVLVLCLYCKYSDQLIANIEKTWNKHHYKIWVKCDIVQRNGVK